MRSRMDRIVRKCSVIAIIGLSVVVPMPSLHPMHSVAAQTARGESDSTLALQAEEATEQLKEQSLYDSLQKTLEATRYEIGRKGQPAKGSLPPSNHAPKPAQQLDASLTSDSMCLRPSRAIHKDIGSSAILDDTSRSAEAP